jgi:hypothetical protein
MLPFSKVLGSAISRQVPRHIMSKVKAGATSFQLPLVDFTPFSSNVAMHRIHWSNNNSLPKRSMTPITLMALLSTKLGNFQIQTPSCGSCLSGLVYFQNPIDPWSNTGYVGHGIESLSANRRIDLKKAVIFVIRLLPMEGL